MNATSMHRSTVQSPHERYRERLTLLCRDEALDLALAEAAVRYSWPRVGNAWRRSYGRFYPDVATFATLVYETKDDPQQLMRLDIAEDRPPENPRTISIRDSRLGWIGCTPFPLDRALSTLDAVMEHWPGARVIRYRPERRCTLRSRSGDRFVKVFSDDRDGLKQYREGQLLWHESVAGRLDFGVACPGSWTASRRTLTYGAIDGQPVSEGSFVGQGMELSHRMGRAIGSLAGSSLEPSTTFDARDQFNRTVRTMEEVVVRVPMLQADLAAVLSQLQTLHGSFDPRQLRPAHGSPHAKQWLIGNDRLGLVDFEKFCRADAELDVGTFLAEIDFEDGNDICVAEIAASFIEGFESVAGRLDRARLMAYRAHKQIVKVLKAAQSIRPDGDQRAARHLQRIGPMLRNGHASSPINSRQAGSLSHSK